jgi:hypothetical protein
VRLHPRCRDLAARHQHDHLRPVCGGRPDLDGFNRLRAVETLANLRYQQRMGRRTDFGVERTVHHRLVREIRAEIAALGLPEPAASWARTFDIE